MAQPVAEASRARAVRLVRLLLPVPGRLQFSLRLALVCALTAFVAELYQTPDPALTVYVAFFLIKPDRVTSIMLSVVMVLILSVTLLFVLLATMAVIGRPMWLVATMAVLSLALMFLASASKLRPIAPIIALIAGYALDLLGAIHNVGEVATRALLYSWLFVGIPAGVSILVNLFGGSAPRRLAERALAHRLSIAAVMLRGPEEKTWHEFESALRQGIGQILSWLRLAAIERTSSSAQLAALRQASRSTMQIELLIDMIIRTPGSFLPPVAAACLAEKLDAMAAILADGSYPVDIERSVEQPGNSPEAASWWAEMQANLVNFAVPPRCSVKPAPRKKADGGFLAADALTNPVHIRHALKTTGAAMFCYILYSLLDWPNIHTCMLTCYIVALGTTAETVEKLSLRILGCILGAAAGIATIIFLMPDLTSIGSLMIIIFLATLASAWVAGGSDRISYAGFQIAFAFLLCVLQGDGPAFDMVTARDRVIGILLGNVVVYLVFTNIWPVSVASRVDPAITALLRQWSTLLRAGRQAAAGMASQALMSMSAIERDLELLAYEPESIRPDEGWFVRRLEATASLASLAGVFWLCARRSPALSKYMSTCLEHAARLTGEAPEPNTPAACAESELAMIAWADIGTEPSSAALRSFVDAHLRNIESSMASAAEQSVVRIHARA